MSCDNKASEILTAAAAHLKARESTYDSPGGERSIQKTVRLFEEATGIKMSEEQGWLFMLMLKVVRSQQGDYRADSYEDGSAYFALMGEAASLSERAGPVNKGYIGLRRSDE